MVTTSTSSPLPVRVAVAGFGTVGQAVIRLLQNQSEGFRRRWNVDLRLVAVLDRSHARKDTSWISPDTRFTDSIAEFQNTSADVFVELIGGMSPAREIIGSGLRDKTAVVTANKLLMARQGTELLNLAAERHSYLGFEAAVAGGIPIIRAVRRSFFSDQIVGVRGILNGTCNYILSEMAERGREYESALSQAQSLGYAEADPTLDVCGADTTDKLAILATLCFGAGILPDQIPTRGITDVDSTDFLYCQRLNSTIKLVGIVHHSRKRLSLRVSPFLIDNSLPLSKVSGVLNAVEIVGETLGPVIISGQGAGGGPTAVSVVADVLNAALWRREALLTSDEGLPPPAPLDAAGGEGEYTLSQEKECYPFYIRFFVADRPGIISDLARRLADRGISIDSVLQESWSDRSNLPFVITVEPTPFSILHEAVEEMAKLDFNRRPPLPLPILRQ